MQEIEFSSADQVLRFCLFCGTENITTDAKVKECPHLHFVGTDEGIVYDKNKIYENLMEIPHVEDLRKGFNDNYVCITTSAPAPSGFSAFAVYKFIEED